MTELLALNDHVLKYSLQEGNETICCGCGTRKAPMLSFGRGSMIWYRDKVS